MDPQSVINMAGKALPVVLDVLGILPGVGSVTSALRLVGDAISVEQTVYNALMSPAGVKARAEIKGKLKKMGVDASFLATDSGGLIKLEVFNEVLSDMRSGNF